MYSLTPAFLRPSSKHHFYPSTDYITVLLLFDLEIKETSFVIRTRFKCFFVETIKLFVFCWLTYTSWSSLLFEGTRRNFVEIQLVFSHFLGLVSKQTSQMAKETKPVAEFYEKSALSKRKTWTAPANCSQTKYSLWTTELLPWFTGCSSCERPSPHISRHFDFSQRYKL